MCRYLVVRSDDRFAQSVATPSVTAFLSVMPALRQDTPASYSGIDAISGAHLLLLDCDSGGNYTVFAGAPAPDRINRVELICSCFGAQHVPEWEALAGRIAEFLAWEVIDDETDEILVPRPGGDGDGH